MKLEPGMAFDTKVQNKVFAFLSILLLLSTVWVILDDYIRPWKAVQIKALDIKKEVLGEKLKAVKASVKPEEVAALKKAIEAGQKIRDSRQAEVDALKKELGETQAKIYAQKIINGADGSSSSAMTFQWEMKKEHGKDAAAKKLKGKLDALNIKWGKGKDYFKQLTTDEKNVLNAIAAKSKELKLAQKDYKEKAGKLDMTQEAYDSASFFSDPINFLRNAPFIDYLDPTIKIQQVVAENITEDRYFKQTEKVDRCMTCHTFIDKPGYEKKDNPYKTHPNLNLMVGADSPHPMKKTGCTTCHGGEGQRVFDFNAAEHRPENEKQKQEWIAKYHYHEGHKIAQPIRKKSQTEAGCVKCHQGKEFIPQADRLNKGRQLVQTYGCYGCHKIKGWEHLRKPGPSLYKISSKVSKEWTKNWVWFPRHFNPKTKMPHYFNQSNNSKPEFLKKNVAEVNSIVEYLFKNSKSFSPFTRYNGGNADKGKALIQNVGCISCHQVEGIGNDFNKVGSKKGPYLTGLGSKVSGDWLVSWLMRPSHYQEDTVMPSFRLSKREASDMTSYLLTLKNKKFSEMKFSDLDRSVRDELLLEYFSSFDTIAVAKTKLAGLDDHQRTLELGKRSIGKFGCYSCHNIDGFEGRSPIGVDLTNEGSKPVTQLAFGHEHIEHKRDVWFKNHMLNPRRWDRGNNKGFKDLLRMPNFFMSEEDADLLTVFLLGQNSEKVPMAGQKNLNEYEVAEEKGHRVMSKYNCYGCHNIDGMGGDILKATAYADDPNEAPPILAGQGHRVHTDWFYNFLGNVHTIRPWLKVRMPTFNLSNEEKNTIVDGFRARKKLPVFEEKPEKVVWEPGERAAAKKLITEYACDSCHTLGFNKDEPMAPNLHHAKNRLRASWIEKWLKDPQSVMPGTTMPNFFADGEAQEPSILGGSVDRQVTALRKYIQEIGEKEFPEAGWYEATGFKKPE
ncbi:MAG: c-type cytochrome [Bacteriovoracaceae bacterium]|jgi:cytochrome c551/c552|nr:c-type cytochrome [Bacteriovoracaceae bacterium]